MTLLRRFSDKHKPDYERIMFFSRENSLFLRGLSILHVLVGHPGNMAGEAGLYMFLILSGYGLELSVRHRGFENFWHKRLESVWFPCLDVGSTPTSSTSKQ